MGHTASCHLNPFSLLPQDCRLICVPGSQLDTTLSNRNATGATNMILDFFIGHIK